MNINTKFIRLHNASNNTVVIINVDKIVLIDTDEINSPSGSRIVSIIYTSADSDIQGFTVNETPEKIYDIIRNNTKFIRLHNASNNTVVIINVDKIVLIDTDEINSPSTPRIVSTIYTSADSDIQEFTVNETPEKIYDMIANNK